MANPQVFLVSEGTTAATAAQENLRSSLATHEPSLQLRPAEQPGWIQQCRNAAQRAFEWSSRAARQQIRPPSMTPYEQGFFLGGCAVCVAAAAVWTVVLGEQYLMAQKHPINRLNAERLDDFPVMGISVIAFKNSAGSEGISAYTTPQEHELTIAATNSEFLGNYGAQNIEIFRIRPKNQSVLWKQVKWKSFDDTWADSITSSSFLLPLHFLPSHTSFQHSLASNFECMRETISTYGERNYYGLEWLGCSCRFFPEGKCPLDDLRVPYLEQYNYSSVCWNSPGSCPANFYNKLLPSWPGGPFYIVPFKQTELHSTHNQISALLDALDLRAVVDKDDFSSVKLFVRELEYHFPGGSWVELQPGFNYSYPSRMPSARIGLSFSTDSCMQGSKQVQCPSSVGPTSRIVMQNTTVKAWFPNPPNYLSANFQSNQYETVVTFTLANFGSQWLAYFHAALTTLAFFFPVVVHVPRYFCFGAHPRKHKEILCVEEPDLAPTTISHQQSDRERVQD